MESGTPNSHAMTYLVMVLSFSFLLMAYLFVRRTDLDQHIGIVKQHAGVVADHHKLADFQIFEGHQGLALALGQFHIRRRLRSFSFAVVELSLIKKAELGVFRRQTEREIRGFATIFLTGLEQLLAPCRAYFLAFHRNLIGREA